ncbi:MAG TPA: hypothetical protein VFS67_15630 [Polyangiaceae bacterium]|nr:hypothetical protein [Polyangiaceae bacterium]
MPLHRPFPSSAGLPCAPLAALVTAALVSWAGAAGANPRPLPFSYQHEQIAKGAAELEQYVDLTPVRAQDAATGELRWYGLSQFATEFEYGLSDRLELGLYVTYAPAASSGFSNVVSPPDGNGMKQRLRFKLAETGEWPIDVSLYGETVENEREFELEAKVILQRRFGMARLIANASAEQEFYYDGKHDLVLNPSAGLTFELSPTIQPGIEWWMRAEYPLEDPPDPRPFQLGPHHYLGPTVLLQFGALWWTTGIYFRLSEASHTMNLGEGFGAIWARSVLGIEL